MIWSERDDGGGSQAVVAELLGVLTCGETGGPRQALALRIIGERLANGDASPELLTVSFKVDQNVAEHPCSTGSGGPCEHRMGAQTSVGHSRADL